jgi:hypothetical protein
VRQSLPGFHDSNNRSVDGVVTVDLHRLRGVGGVGHGGQRQTDHISLGAGQSED